jgi:hypothetical protein
MNIRRKSRRDFLKYSAIVAAATAGSGVLSSCASFDDYLFDDKSTMDEEVVIIGGGIAGLYLAKQLRAKQVEFRLYEAGNSLGGRIKSFAGRDYGASTLSKRDVLANALINELKIEKVFLDKENFFISNGMQTVVNALNDRILGLIPYRNFRMRWPLIEIQKLKADYELTFQLEQAQKKVRCKKIVFAIPPSQWGKIKGLLELPEMELAKSMYNSLKTESIIRLVLPSSALPSSARGISEFNFENFDVRQIVKKHQNTLPIELDIKYSSNVNFSIDYVYGELKKKLQVNYPFVKLGSDQFYGWGQAPFIQGAYFKMNMGIKPELNSSFQLIGDAVSSLAPNRIEGALQSAQAASEAFI